MSTQRKTPRGDIRKRIEDDLKDAYDFDSRDPLFGLSKDEMSGPALSRRAALRLMAAAGTLTAWHLMPRGGIGKSHAASGGTLNCGWAAVGEIRTIDPAQINQVLEFQISSNVLSGLMHIDADLVPRGDLAASWTVTDDGKEYTFELREGVRYHNGDPFTADDVIFTYNRSKDPKQSIHLKTIANINDVVKVNDHTVRFILKAPQASFLGKTLERSSGRAMTIVSRGALASMGAAEYGLKAVGTGPFKVTAHTLGQGMVLERNENYYDPDRPKLDKVTITPIIDAEPLAAAIEAGDIQLIGGNPVAPELVDRFEANPDLVVDIVPAPGFQSVWLNPWRDPFKVASFSKPLSELMKEKGFKVRLAIAKAIDRDRYIEVAQFGRGVPAYGSINPAMGFYFDEGLAETSNQRYDPEAARKLLAEAGYPNGEGFPKLKILCTPAARREVQVIKDILKRNLNIDIQLDPQDFPVMVDNFWSMNWDLLRIGSGGDYDPDDGLADFMYGSAKFNGPKRDKSKMPTFGYFGDDEADALIDKQTLQADLNVRKALVQQANKITSDKVTTAFIFHPMDILVYHKRVNFPKISRIPGLVDLDRTTIS